jgi:UDP-N-acetylglucosamine--N-acetylmuramyl-(pentapeptide) pyrophosphoryl-undecaprenol N-acetylglucosamine transferase
MNGWPDALVALAAGGTGGHVFPAQALAAELAQRGYRLVLITDRRGGAFGGSLGGIETYRIRASGVAGKRLRALLLSGPNLAVGTVQARHLLKRLKPAVVIGFGGYASVPTLLAATFGGLRTAIHEQNAILGRANRLLASKVARVATSFVVSEGLSADAAHKVTHTGMPVRPAVAAMRARPYPGLAGEGPIELLVLGGSQGARVFSTVVPEAIGHLADGLRRRLRIAQQCRPEDLEDAGRRYRELGMEADLAAFFDDVPERLARAHLVIARAGASTVAEITAVGRPAILVPYPSAVDDHQTANAHAMVEVGAGWLMPQDAFAPETLAARLTALFELPATLEKTAASARAAGRADAAARLADVVVELVPNGETEGRRRAA